MFEDPAAQPHDFDPATFGQPFDFRTLLLEKKWRWIFVRPDQMDAKTAFRRAMEQGVRIQHRRRMQNGVEGFLVRRTA